MDNFARRVNYALQRYKDVTGAEAEQFVLSRQGTDDADAWLTPAQRRRIRHTGRDFIISPYAARREAERAALARKAAHWGPAASAPLSGPRGGRAAFVTIDEVQRLLPLPTVPNKDNPAQDPANPPVTGRGRRVPGRNLLRARSGGRGG